MSKTKSGGADQEIQAAITDLREKTNTCNTQVAFINEVNENINVKIARIEYVRSNLSDTPDDIRTYSSCGRMFLLTSKNDVLSNMVKEEGECKTNLKKNQETIEKLQSHVKQSENSLRELIEAKKQQAV